MIRTLRLLLVFTTLLFTNAALAQGVFSIPTDYSKDTLRVCSGVLVDGGGISGNYSSGDVGEVFIDPPGDGKVTFTFTQWNVGSIGTALYCRDETNNTWIAVYSGVNPPALNTPIVTNAQRLYFRFYASFNSNPGFQLSWTTDSTTAPVSSFTSSDSIIPFNTAVDFTNLGSPKNESAWDFDEGPISTEYSPTYTFTQAGPHSVELITSNCAGADTLVQPILVEQRPDIAISTDTLKLQVQCGDSANASLTVHNNSSTGRMLLESALLDSNISFAADFETPGYFDDFSYSGTNAISLQSSTTSYGAGTSLKVSGRTGSQAVSRTFSPKRPNRVSFAFRGGTYYERGSYVTYKDAQNNSLFGYVAYDFATAYLTVRFKKNGYAQTDNDFIASQTGPEWVLVSYENIDWANGTFDLYLNNSLYIKDCEFFSQAQNVAKIELSTNRTSAVAYLDRIRFYGDEYSASINSNHSTVHGGDSTQIDFSFFANGTVGTSRFNIVLAFNDTVNSTRIIPVEVTVDGTGILSATDSLCTPRYGYTNRTQKEVLQVYNSGCDLIQFSGVTASSSRLQNFSLPSTLPVGDTAQIPFEFLSTMSGQFSDTAFLVTADSTYTFCVGLSVSDAPMIELDSNEFPIFSTVCSDTLMTSMTIFNRGTQDLTWSIHQPDSFYTDDFEAAGLDTSFWESLGDGAYIGSNCGTIAGSSSLTFKGGFSDPRTATTKPLNLLDGGRVSFQMYQGSCGNAGANMPMHLQYSLDGNVWVDFGQFHTWEWATYPSFSAKIPEAASAVGVRLRLIQKVHGTNNSWVVDNFQLQLNRSREVFSDPISGTVLPGDSQVVSLLVDTRGLASGTYPLSFKLINSDPLTPILSLPVILTLDGPSALNYSKSSCLNLDTLLQGATVVDTIPLWNNGCGRAVIDSIWSTDTLLTGMYQDSVLHIGDTTLIISTLYADVIQGINDTLFLQTTDSLITFCYNGVVKESPRFALNIDSLFVSSANCSDTIDFEFYVKNTASSQTTLDWTIEPASPLNVFLVNVNVFMPLAENFENSLRQLPYVNVRKSTNIADLASQMDWADVIVFTPINANASAANYTSLEKELRTFMTNGGTIVVMGSPENSKLFSVDFMNATTKSNHTNELLTISPTAGTYASGVTDFTAQTAALSSTITHLNPVPNHVISKSWNEHIYSIMDFEDGRLVYFGFTFTKVYDEIEKLLENLMNERRAVLPTSFAWLNINQTSGQITGSDSAKVSGQVYLSALDKQVKEVDLELTTNDPLAQHSAVPLVAANQGKGILDLSQGCFNFGNVPYTGLTGKSILLRNVGCSPLKIDSVDFTNTSFVLNQPIPFIIDPNSDWELELLCSSPGLGQLQDTLNIFTDSDTLGLCVTYTGVGTPIIETVPDTLLQAKVNQCSPSFLESFEVLNQGLDSLSYNVFVGAINDTLYTQEWPYDPSSTAQELIFEYNTVLDSDTLHYSLFLNGRFQDSSSRFYVLLNGTQVGFFYDNNVPNYQTDTIHGIITGTVLQNAINQGYFRFKLLMYDGTLHTDQYATLRIFQKTASDWAASNSTGSGIVVPGGQQLENITIDPSNLSVGIHNTTIYLYNNDPILPLYTLPMRLEVYNRAVLELSTDTLSLGIVNTAGSVVDSALVVNTGCAPLLISMVSSSDNSFVPSWTSKTIAAGAGAWLPVSFNPATSGFQSAIISIMSNDTTRTLVVNADAQILPTASFGYTTTNACKGKVSFSNTSDFATTFSWDFGDGGVSTSENPNYTFEKPGAYTVQMIASSPMGQDTTSVIVNASDVLYLRGIYPDTAGLGPTLFIDSSLVPVQRSWSFGDGNFSTDSVVSHTYTNPGTYFVTLGIENAAGCTSTEVRVIQIINDIGIAQEDNEDLSIYPVPSRGKVHIKAADEIRFVKVFNAQGAEVLQLKQSNEVDLSRLPAGVYVFHIFGYDWAVVRSVELMK